MILYVITYDTGKSPTFKRRTGSYELDMDRMTKANVIKDVRDGQFDDVARIYECEVGGQCTDITEDVAREIYFDLDANCEPCPAFLRAWLDEHYRAGAANELDRAAPRSDYAEHNTLSRAYQ